MKIYMATAYNAIVHPLHSDKAFMYRKLWKKYYLKNTPILESYHYIKGSQVLESALQRKETIFLDSGAFSMFTQGIDVNLEEYANFIHTYDKAIHAASNIDHIGSGGEQKTYDNQKILESMGVNVCPVHHARDKDYWLERYIDEGYKYIFLGGMVPETTKYLEYWLDRIWGQILTGKNGAPKVHVHGFGLTTPRLMYKYPWYSVDSTTWVLVSGMGGILIPVHGGKLVVLGISDRSPSRKKIGCHYNTITQQEREVVDKCIKRFGFKRKRLRDSYQARRAWCLHVFRWVQDNYKWPKKFVNKTVNLFN